MDVSKNRGNKKQKWMVFIMEKPIRMDDLGVFPYFWKHPYLHVSQYLGMRFWERDWDHVEARIIQLFRGAKKSSPFPYVYIYIFI